MSWRVTVVVSDVNGAPVEGAQLRRTVWTGGPSVDEMPPIKIGGQFTFDVDERARSIVCDVQHPHHAPLVISMVRSSGERVWRWTNATRQVATSGQNVTVGAVLGRLRWPPTSFIPEDTLKRSAELRKRPVDDHARAQQKKPPIFVPMDEAYRSLLTTRDSGSYRLQAGLQRKIADFHVVAPDLIGTDPTRPGWGRFAFQLAAVDPARSGQFFIAEYGEVASAQAPGPRFLVGLWIPNTLARLGLQSLDFIVWLHPTTTSNAAFYPQDTYPYRSKYPFAIWAETLSDGAFSATQRYVDIPIHHLYSQHFLLYQMEAARRSAVIVIPMAPSGDFGPLVSQSSLFRLLKELCLWMPRGDGAGQPGRFPPPPMVGRVAISGFSSSGPLLQTLIDSRQAVLPYGETEWGAGPQKGGARFGVPPDGRSFDAAWREIWSIDDVAQGFATFVERSLQWFKGREERSLRIYKAAFTGGWDLENPRSAELSRFLSRGRTVKRESGKLKAVVAQDPGGRWTFASFSNEYLSGPAPAGPPAPALEPNSPHEMMPRLMFGHAAGLSLLTRS